MWLVSSLCLVFAVLDWLLAGVRLAVWLDLSISHKKALVFRSRVWYRGEARVPCKCARALPGPRVIPRVGGSAAAVVLAEPAQTREG